MAELWMNAYGDNSPARAAASLQALEMAWAVKTGAVKTGAVKTGAVKTGAVKTGAVKAWGHHDSGRLDHQPRPSGMWWRWFKRKR